MVGKTFRSQPIFLTGEAAMKRLKSERSTFARAGLFTGFSEVSDADASYIRAKAAGAKIVRAIQDEDYGGRAFSCLDTEGHLWNFGTYDPRKAHA